MRAKLTTAGIFFIVLVGCNTMVGPTTSDIPASIATAKTPSDHQKIAAYFTQKAAEYDKEAAQHEMMAQSYSNRPKGGFGSMISHCRNLRDQFVSAAKMARSLAQEHQQMPAKGS